MSSSRSARGGSVAAARFARGLFSPDSRALLVIQVAPLLVLTGFAATRLWSDHLWLSWSLVGLTALVWLPELSRPRTRRWWFIYVVGIFVYTLLRSYADDTSIPTRVSYAIEIDRALIFWTNADPVVWLQRQFFEPGKVGWFDLGSFAIHWSFFVAPHAAAGLVFWRQRRLFRRYVLFLVAIAYAGLLLFFLVPTAPPWLAAQVGELPGAFRVVHFVRGDVDLQTSEAFYASLEEPNSVAAMPSIHMAMTFALYLWARAHAPRLAWGLLLYSLLMAFALVYLAEHYIADMAVGALIAVLCWLAVTRIAGEQRELGASRARAPNDG